MSTILILGGTGTLGRAAERALRERGAEVRSASRSTGVDVTTGEGLDDALRGVAAVVDATNGPPSGRARRVLVDGTRRLLAAEARAGVGHHVCVSIVGCDRVPLAYYRVKAEQERVVADGPVPWTIMRATQFHDLVRRWAGMPLMPLRGVPLQPADVAEVAGVVAGVALGEARRSAVTVAGPEVLDMGDVARLVGRRGPLLALPGGLGRALREGRLTDEDPGVRTTRTFSQWLTT